MLKSFTGPESVRRDYEVKGRTMRLLRGCVTQQLSMVLPQTATLRRIFFFDYFERALTST